MSSALSGYVRMRSNASWPEHPPKTVCTTLSVPANHTVVISIEQIVQRQPLVNVFCLTSGGEKRILWKRSHMNSDFAHMCNATDIFLKVGSSDCINSSCFKLFFSFFPEKKRPVKLASGFWNCSVEHYASFHHHLACNLETECEDGQDETGPCPYSSPQCQGKLALCHRCYTITRSLRGFDSDETDVNIRANDYCNSIGGQLSLPKCVYDWIKTIQKKTNIHEDRMRSIWTGLYTNDLSIESMYIHSAVHEDKTVLHHSSEFVTDVLRTSRYCLFLIYKPLYLRAFPCTLSHHSILARGAFCEFEENSTEKAVLPSQTRYATGVEFPLLPAQQSMTKCPDGHVTHTFFLCSSNRYQLCGQQFTPSCVFSDGLSDRPVSASADQHASLVPAFPCDDGVTKVSYTLVCDFIPDCPDHSDESFCRHPPCVNQFRCSNGQCLSVDKVCDHMFHCKDRSDDKHCKEFRMRILDISAPIPPPAFVNFDGLKIFTSTPMNVSEPCPDTHFRCPGDFNDCLPVYTRCNSMYDCIDHQDEEGCEDITCSGFFRCRLSEICVHSEHICDGWPHCPQNDDELSCDVICPTTCLCQGQTFVCPQPFSAALFPQLRYLDATGSGMSLSDVENNALLIGADFAHCSVHLLPKVNLLNLRFLELSSNILQYINTTSLLGLENLQSLSLSHNPLTSLHTGPPSAVQHKSLTSLDLSHTTLTVLDTTALSLFPHLQTLNVTSTSIHTISAEGFQTTPQLGEAYMDKSPIQTFPPDVFKSLSNLRHVSAQSYKFCCSETLPYNFDSSDCIAPTDEISSCEDLLQSWTYRGFLWLVACLSLTGNVFCCCARLFAKRLTSSSGFSVFVTNLSMADFLMGVYITVIGVADEKFRGRYLYKDDTWKHSVVCKMAGFLSLLSSEVSALIIWFITLDRFIVLRFPFSTVRFDRTSAALACLLTWLAGCLLALLPLLPVTSHWQFYSQTGICVPLPVTRQDFKGRVYSFSVLIVFNFIVFLFVSVGQALIYWTIQQSAMKTDSTKVSRDMTIARRLITIAVTDFLCWFPIGLCGLLALAGVAIPGEINVILAIFVLPLNAAINPFMYTFNTLAEKRRKAKEANLLQWLQSHPDCLVD